jgi:hypothetical protein
VTAYPGSPSTLRGAIVGFDLANPVASVIVFQYNPHTLVRRLEPRSAPSDGAPGEVTRIGGAPVETITLEVEIDATDQLETEDKNAVSMGVHPQLAALEMLLYPKTLEVIAATALLAAGSMVFVPPEGPFTLLIWGIKRVLPVRVTQLSITEVAHDAQLNPIRATAELGLRVLTYDDYPITHVGWWTFMAHQVVKETMATIGSINNLGAVLHGDVKLI